VVQNRWLEWAETRQIEREVTRTRAALARHDSAMLREQAAANRWFAERHREYLQFLRSGPAAGSGSADLP